MATAATLIARARQHGIHIPVRAYRASRKAGVPFYVTCAFLMQESAGGLNVFGHDPGNFSGAGVVTRDKYLAYKAARRAGKGMQGVGPMQLTWWEFQDRADALGGCWRPYYNVLAGLEVLHGLHQTYGNWGTAAYHYNGSGAAAAAYEREMLSRFSYWQSVLGV